MTHSFNLKVTGAAVAFALAALAGTASAAAPGYVTDQQNQVWTSPFGLCWKTTDWTPDKAMAPCDAVRRAEAPVPPPVAIAPPPPPPPAPAPTPLVTAPPAPPPIIEQISLSSDVLFEFDKAELRPDGQKKLDEVADRVKGANVQQVNAIGHADRIGSDQYNQQLSEKRADSVKQYLASKGIAQDVRSEGRGEAEPVTGDQCKGISGEKLKACLQPDRRVDIEVRGSRQVAAGEAPAAAGGTAGSSSSSSSSSSGTSANPSSPSSTGAQGLAPAAPGSSSATPGTAK